MNDLIKDVKTEQTENGTKYKIDDGKPRRKIYLPQDMDTSCFPTAIRRWLDHGCESLSQSPQMFVLPLLTLVGGLIGINRRIKTKSDHVQPPIIWTAIVGKTGDGKTDCRNFVSKPFDAIDAELRERDQDRRRQYEQDRALHEVSLAEWKSDQKKYLQGKAPDPGPMPQAPEAFIPDF